MHPAIAQMLLTQKMALVIMHAKLALLRMAD